MKRWDRQGLTVTQRAIIDRLKAIGPMTTQELIDELEMSRDGVRKALNGLHEMRRVFIKAWPYQGTQRARQWAWRHAGQEDVPRPPACTKPEWDLHYRERHKHLIARRRSTVPANPFQGLMT
jgi:DNA-binding CsgD family transcriptional regulator